MTRTLAAAAAGTLPQVGRRVGEHRLRRRCARDGVLALTYDDGPGERLTPRLLDVLADHRARATFFPLGRRAEAAPEVMDRIVGDGHEVGCHGYAHLDALRTPREAALRDIAEGYAALAPWLSRRGVFRPPHGKRTLATARALRRRQAPVGWWTIDSGDSLREPPDAEAVVSRVTAAGGGVVLLHDFDRGTDDRAREDYVLELTAALLATARRRGWRVATAGTLVA